MEMEIVRKYIETDSDEEIYFGPITKKEILSKLKYHNLCKHELLEPLEVFKDTDILNDTLINFYEDIFSKCNENISQDESVLEIQSFEDQFQDSLEISKKESFTESKLLQSECYSQKELTITVDESALLNSTCSSNASQDEEENWCSSPNEKDTILINSSNEISECLHNNSENFNCTLEEMEMLLKFGEHYINESKTSKPAEETEKENDPPIFLTNSNNIKKSPLPNISKSKSPVKNKNKKLSPHNAEYKFLTPNNEPVQKSNSKSHKTSPSPFKLTARVDRSPVFKNIQSPIAMYIKNSARVPLVQNVAKHTIESGTYKVPGDSGLGRASGDRESMPDAGLPVRCYKRAPRAVVISDEPEPNLPPSIRRLIPGRVTPQIIKHVARAHAQQPDPDNDMTILSTSTSQQAQPDVSFYISKNAARTNRLQRL